MTIARRPLYSDVQLAELGLTPDAVVSPRRESDRARITRWSHPRVSLSAWTARHSTSLSVLAPVLVVAAVLHGWNMLHSPGPNDDEGTYVSQAWSVQAYGELSHYTYWYDHPPLGWLLLTVWNTILLVTPRDASLLDAGRQAMLVVHLVTCVLLFVLARRIGLPRWAAAVAVTLFTLSPLGLQWTRLTLLDNIATPLVVASWVFALSRRRRLASFAVSGFLLAAAVLVKETSALFALPIAAQIWFTSRGHTRRFGVVLFVGSVVGFCGLYPLYALLKNEFFPGEGHVSLLWAIQWQLFSRPGSGSLLDPGSDTRLAITQWLEQDGLLLVGALVLGPLAWRYRAIRPLLAAYLVLVVMPLRGGYIPAPYPVNLLWPASLLAAAGVSVASRAMYAVLPARPTFVRPAGAVVLLCLFLATATHALAKDVPYLTADEDRNYRAAQEWLFRHTSHSDVLLVDNTVWIELVEAGYPRENVIWFYKLDLDPAVLTQHPGGWRDIDYVVSSSIIDISRDDLPRTSAAIDHGTAVAEFGDIQILRVSRDRGLDVNQPRGMDRK